MPRPHIPLSRRLTLAALVFPLACAALAPQNSFAQRQRSSRASTERDCQLQSGGESTVVSISGPQTLRLADGRFVRLSEVLVPTAPPFGYDPSAPAAGYLQNAALGRKVEVKFGGTQRDRYGVYDGHVYVAGERPLWLEEGLVSNGFARVFPQADNHACARQLIPFEEAARNEKRGLWGLAYFKVLAARDFRMLLNLVQSYQIVEGKVDHTTEGGGRLTLFFAQEGRPGFSTVLEPSAKRAIAAKVERTGWAGLRVRIRGWVDRKRGPSIPVTQPEQIEFLAEEPTNAEK